MKAITLRLEHTIEYLMAIALGIMVLMVFGNVVLRYGFNSGIAAAEEISRLMFVWLIFLGAILALRHHAHLGVEMLQARLPSWARRSCAILSHVLILFALWLFLSGSWTQTIIGTRTYSTVLGYPTAFMSSAGLVCAASMLIIVAVNLWRIITCHPSAVIPGESAAVEMSASTNNLLD